MKLTRRNTLLGLGTIVGGIGIVGASGAFDTVQADRDFDVEVAEDADALLELRVGDGEGAEEYVNDDGETIEIDIGNGDDDVAGINENALTTFNDLLIVGNNGEQDVEVWFETGDMDGIGFRTDEKMITDIDSPEEDPETVEVGIDDDEDVDISLDIDTRVDENNDYGGTYVDEEEEDVPVITIHAAADGNEDFN